MRIAVGSDERTKLTDFVVADLEKRGHEATCFGPLAAGPLAWPQVAEKVAREVKSGNCQQGILFCWTGTGVCIAANKIAGIRAALCCDAYTAAGARKWNDANILVLSLRNTSEAIAREILDDWFAPVSCAEDDAASVQYLAEIEKKP